MDVTGSGCPRDADVHLTNTRIRLDAKVSLGRCSWLEILLLNSNGLRDVFGDIGAGGAAILDPLRPRIVCSIAEHRVSLMPGAEEKIIYQLLTAIDNDSDVSQRRLSFDIGIAVGSVNWYLKRCLTKGLIKLKQAPMKRYIYYLTPKGLEEKSRLTAEYLQNSLELYRLGRRQCTEFFGECVGKAKKRVFLIGDGDLAEIACLSSLGTNVQVRAVIDDRSGRQTCAGVPVFTTVSAAVAATGGELPDAILLTDLSRPRRAYAAAALQFSEVGLPADVVHVPGILNFDPRRAP